MHQRQLVPGRRGRLRERVGREDSLGQAALAEPRVLYHRETVSRWKGEDEAVGVEGAEAGRVRRRGHGIPATLWVWTESRHGGPSSITAAIASP